jgi:glycyl-tRNA synthetase (class II)
MVTKEKVEETIKKAFFNFSDKYGYQPEEVSFMVHDFKGELNYHVIGPDSTKLETTNVNEIIGIPKVADVLLGVGKKVNAAILKAASEKQMDLQRGILHFKMKMAVVKVFYRISNQSTEYSLNEIIPV